jgi:hypothetical protein
MSQSQKLNEKACTTTVKVELQALFSYYSLSKVGHKNSENDFWDSPFFYFTDNPG